MVKVRLWVSVLVVCFAVAFLPSTAWADYKPSLTVTCSSQFVGRNCTFAQDGSATTSWMGDGNQATKFPQWVRLSSSTDLTIGSYVVQAWNQELARTAKAWTFQSSTDGGTNWTTRDSRSAEINWTSTESRTYTLSTPVTAKDFRLLITESWNDASWTALSEFQVNDAPAQTTTTTATTSTVTSTVTATATTTVTAMPTSLKIEDTQFGVIALCGGLVVFCVATLMVIGFRR